MNYHFCKHSAFKLGVYKTLNQVYIIIGKVLRYQRTLLSIYCKYVSLLSIVNSLLALKHILYRNVYIDIYNLIIMWIYPKLIFKFH